VEPVVVRQRDRLPEPTRPEGALDPAVGGPVHDHRGSLRVQPVERRRHDVSGHRLGGGDEHELVRPLERQAGDQGGEAGADVE
jgi:hypothetical protein